MKTEKPIYKGEKMTDTINCDSNKVVVPLTICEGVGGLCVYLNDHRIAGSKPWGGGTALIRFNCNVREVFSAIESIIERDYVKKSELPSVEEIYDNITDFLDSNSDAKELAEVINELIHGGKDD